jgi:hypothetical protein
MAGETVTESCSEHHSYESVDTPTEETMAESGENDNVIDNVDLEPDRYVDDDFEAARGGLCSSAPHSNFIYMTSSG